MGSSWCEANTLIRYPIISSKIIPYHKNKENDMMEWTPLALRIINNSHDSIKLLNRFKTSMHVSKAEVMQSRLCLIIYFKKHEDSLIAELAYKEEKIFDKLII